MFINFFAKADFIEGQLLFGAISLHKPQNGTKRKFNTLLFSDLGKCERIFGVLTLLCTIITPLIYYYLFTIYTLRKITVITVCFLYCVFVLSAISPFTTRLKVLFNQSDCTGTAPTHK